MQPTYNIDNPHLSYEDKQELWETGFGLQKVDGLAPSVYMEELARLDKELSKWQKELDMVGKKLSNERFIANAKPEVVEKEKEKQADYQAKYDATQERIAEMEKLGK